MDQPQRQQPQRNRAVVVTAVDLPAFRQQYPDARPSAWPYHTNGTARWVFYVPEAVVQSTDEAAIR